MEPGEEIPRTSERAGIKKVVEKEHAKMPKMPDIHSKLEDNNIPSPVVVCFKPSDVGVVLKPIIEEETTEEKESKVMVVFKPTKVAVVLLPDENLVEKKLEEVNQNVEVVIKPKEEVVHKPSIIVVLKPGDKGYVDPCEDVFLKQTEESDLKSSEELVQRPSRTLSVIPNFNQEVALLTDRYTLMVPHQKKYKKTTDASSKHSKEV